MSEPLSTADEEHYTNIIDGILRTADLQTVTMKKIRSGLEIALNGKDLSDHKQAVKALIGARFDAATANIMDDATEPAPAASETPKRDYDKMANGNGTVVKSEEDEDEDVEEGQDQINVSVPPPKKKQKRESSTESADEKFARQLQAEEEQMARARTTRGGRDKKAVPKKKAAKKKSKAKVGADDDEDVSGDASQKRKAGGGFQKPFNLSAPLAEVCGEPTLSRPQVVKKLWEHIKGNNLQDPADKRQILCDEKMQAVFKQSSLNMFAMNKLIGSHLYPVDEET